MGLWTRYPRAPRSGWRAGPQRESRRLGGAEEGRAPPASLKSVLEAVSFNVSFYKPTPIPNNSILYSRNKNAHL